MIIYSYGLLKICNCLACFMVTGEAYGAFDSRRLIKCF